MWNITAFETKDLRAFNSMLGNGHRVMVLDRGGTYTLAVFDGQLQVLGFPQILIDGHCEPLKKHKEEIRYALKGQAVLTATGGSFLDLYEAVRREGLHPGSYRREAEMVESFFLACVHVGKEGIGNPAVLIDDFVFRWKKVLGKD